MQNKINTSSYCKAIAVSLVLVLLSCSPKDTKKPQTAVPFDSSTIVASGTATEILVPNNVFVDTGMNIIVKGKGFDPTKKNDYFLVVIYGKTSYTTKDTIISDEIHFTKPVRDLKLVTVTDSTILFKLPFHDVNFDFDSTHLFFAKLKHGTSSYSYSSNRSSAEMYINLRKTIKMLPLYRLLHDTLTLNKTYKPSKPIIGTHKYKSWSLKFFIDGIQYPTTDGYFINDEDSSTPYIWLLFSMTATQSMFTMSDGWHTLEISELDSPFRKLVEETGKTKIYIKNE